MLGLSRSILFGLGMAWIVAGLLLGLLWLLDRPGVEIAWQTETEFNSAGFNILRAETEQGPFVRVNDRLIPASEDASAGADYLFMDMDVVGGEHYYYRLEDVDLSGNVTRHAPISAEAPGKPVWILAASILSVLAGSTIMVSARRNNQG